MTRLRAWTNAAPIDPGSLVQELHMTHACTLSFGGPARVVRELINEKVVSLDDDAVLYMQLAANAMA